VLEHLLACYGVEVATATNGQIAVDLFKAALEKDCLCTDRTFRLIFMDIQMPVMGGLQATQEILAAHKALSPAQWCDTSIVAVTAYTGQQNEDDCLGAGMLLVMPKPVSAATLRQVMRAHFYYGRLPPEI